jgi:flagellar biogenesis protein FliO
VAAALESYVTESIALLIVIVALAVLVSFVARRAGLGRVLGPVELLARLPLEARRSVYVVRVVDRVLILGASEAGLVKLGELDKEALRAGSSEPRPTFASLLDAVWRGPSVARPEAELGPDVAPPDGERERVRSAPGSGREGGAAP